MKTGIIAALSLLSVFVSFDTAKVQSIEENLTRLLVEFKSKPSDFSEFQRLDGVASIKKFDRLKNEYFEKLYVFRVHKSKKHNLSALLSAKSEIASVEPVHTVTSFSIAAQPNSVQATKDSLFSYQWGLYSQGQTLFQDIDDIHSEKIQTTDGADIGWKQFSLPIFDLKKQVVVAVIDSGVDLDHEDLKNNIYKNTIECDNGNIPASDQVKDLDGNGYAGDCMGWNFGTPKAEGNNRPYDDSGHGTHVAGIIAAERDNGIGIGSLSNQIKILPIRVTTGKEPGNGSSKNNESGTLTDKIAKGILYAIKMKVDVINISMGWPKALDTKYLRKAFEIADQKGITVVAAAGNNASRDPIFPCSYQNVICVGSTTADGSIADFSNHGGKVDVLAPGDQILSTFPEKLDPRFFNSHGYELKNGSSQAAPFVSAIAAFLKGSLPNSTPEEIRARIFGSSVELSSKNQNGKTTQFGLINLKQALELSPTAIVYPDFKKALELRYDSISKKAVLKLPIRSDWKDAKNVKLDFSITDKSGAGVEIQSESFNLPNIKASEKIELSIPVVIKDEMKDNTLNYQISVSHDGSKDTKKYFHYARIIRRLDSVSGIAPDVIAAPFYGSFQPTTGLRSIDTQFSSVTGLEYYTSEKEKDSVVITIFKLKGKSVVSGSKQINLKGSKRLLSITKVDINLDGNPDYMVRTTALDDEGQFIKYSFVDSNLNPLFGTNTSDWRYNPYDSQVILDISKLRFAKVSIPKLSNKPILVPVVTAQGNIAKVDQNSDPFEPSDTYIEKGYFYFMPVVGPDSTAPKVEARLANNFSFHEKVKKGLGLSFRDNFVFTDLFEQSAQDISLGKLSGLLAVGEGFEKKHYTIKFGENLSFQLTELDTGDVQLEGYQPRRVTLLNDKNSKSSGELAGSLLFGFYSQNQVRHQFIDSEASFDSTISTPNSRDTFLGFLGSYLDKSSQTDPRLLTFYHTKTGFVMENSSSAEPLLTRALSRFSFLPGQLFTELAYPIVWGKSGAEFPALYVDATQIFTSHIYTIILQNGELKVPMKSSIEVPENCMALNPVKNQFGASSAYALFCQIGEKFELRFIPLD